jgi:hypothetical protein
MNKKFIETLSSLNSNQKPVWGKMTPQHMVEHLIFAVQMSNGKLNVECINPTEKLPSLKRFLLSNRALPREYINPVIGADLQPLKYHDLKTAMSNLKEEIEDYNKFFAANPEATPLNVTFGQLNKEEWFIFHNKHFTHHLSQFGLL